ncbi:MAG: glycerophosphodiester phosphodiesterase family protein [Candidatus Aureabacteria bacterium]|nr:glycerophosphodiester phosphodiesterase family protein [Candidatus Auribacterota bacterium]
MAHRGYSARYPENTLLAFRKALEAGCDWIELDIQLSADSAIVVMHDLTLDRTTDGTGDVARATIAAIKTLDAGSWKDPACAGERVLTLREALECTEGHAGLYIELKAVTGAAGAGRNERLCSELAATLVRENGRSSPVLVASFDEPCVRMMGELMPGVTRGLICVNPPSPSRVRRFARWLSVNHRHVTAEMVREFHDLGMRICAWTVDDPDEMKRCAAMGVDAIATNNPPLLNEVLSEATR